jgi:hypothetical protein
MYDIAYDNNDIIIRFPETSVDKKLLANFLGFVELEQMRQKSKLTEEQAASLAREINQRVWDQLQHKVLRLN